MLLFMTDKLHFFTLSWLDNFCFNWIQVPQWSFSINVFVGIKNSSNNNDLRICRGMWVLFSCMMAFAIIINLELLLHSSFFMCNLKCDNWNKTLLISCRYAQKLWRRWWHGEENCLDCYQQHICIFYCIVMSRRWCLNVTQFCW